MIMPVEELRRYIQTDESDQVLEVKLEALEKGIHGYTSNSFERLIAENDGQYPTDVKMGAVAIMRWQLANEAARNGDKSQKPIQSETISRHSITYVTDATETDIDERLGAPKKYTAFLIPYMKARFGQGLSV